MLNDTKIKALKPQEKQYRVTDRDGLYLVVLPTGTKTFRYDYKINGRRETYTLGVYGIVTLARAREMLLEAKRLLAEGISPSQHKQDKRQFESENTLGAWWKKYLDANQGFAPGTLKMKISTYKKDIEPNYANKLLSEIKTSHIRKLCEDINERGAPTTAVRVKTIFNEIYNLAIIKGMDIPNPATPIISKGLYAKVSRNRALSPNDINLFITKLNESELYPAIKLSIEMLLYTMLRKSEVVNAKWNEIDFETKTWTIPADRMKARRAHNVYLSEQVLERFRDLQVYSRGSDYVFPARGNKSKPMAVSSTNRGANETIEKLNGQVEAFVVHDFRRTASTILHEKGYNTDHIEKCLAHVDSSVRGVYNKAEYEAERRILMQDWADMIDKWVSK